MYIEELEETFLFLNIERLRNISRLQKEILRRQNRYKRILTIYLKLYEEWFKMVSNDDSINQSDGLLFEDYHTLLVRVVKKHLEDHDELNSKLGNEKQRQYEYQEAIFKERQKISNIQQQLSMTFQQEDKIAKTLQASKLPDGVYVGFMENVYSGMLKPEDEINFEQYSTYCQVKWTLETVDVEYFSNMNAMFDLKSERIEIEDRIRDILDGYHILQISYKGFYGKMKNLYNIYGFDDYFSYTEDDNDPCYSDLNKTNEKGSMHDGDVQLSAEVNLQQTVETRHKANYNTSNETQDLSNELLASSQFLQPIHQNDEKGLIRTESILFSSYLSESFTSSQQDDDEDEDAPSPLDFDSDDNSLNTTSKISPKESPPNKFPATPSTVSASDDEEDSNVGLKRSSHVVRRPKIDTESLDRRQSTTSVSSVSSQSSLGSVGGKSPKRRINQRRHKLKGTADKDMFVHVPDDFDEKFQKDVENGLEKERNNNFTNSSMPEIMVTSSEKESKNKLNRKSGSGHKKLCRQKGNQSLGEQDVQNLTEQLLSENKKKVTNIQVVLVDGRLLKVSELPPYSVERLSIKNRPRKLSVLLKHRNK